MKFSTLCLSFMLLLSAFIPASAQSFSKGGVSFSFPSDWKVTEEEEVGKDGYYLSCEKEGSDASGLATLTWMKGGETMEVIQAYLNNLKTDLTAKGAKSFVMVEPAPSSFGSYRGVSSSYTFSIGGLDHSGRIYCFSKGGRSYTFIFQEAVEDHKKNLAGFAKIEETFAVK
ncbi:MAG: hypothetical protein JWP27_1167 [Flaviaesturariibacter sp.]|nr:hypothetical protein [Flaviaesturariibacter sp.]